MKWCVSEAVGVVDMSSEAVLHQQLHRLQRVLRSFLSLEFITKKRPLDFFGCKEEA